MRRLALFLLLFVLAAAPLLTSAEPLSSEAPPQTSFPAAPTGTVTLMTENFEGAWPAGLWTASSLSTEWPKTFWGKTTYKPHQGLASVWPGAGGSQPIPPASGYMPDMYTRIVYGPINLGDAASAEVKFWLWLTIETGWDFLRFKASTNPGFPEDASVTEVWSWDVNTDSWEEVSLNLTTSLGASQVWLAWEFESDYLNEYEGPFIDDITVTKTTDFKAPVVSIERSGTSKKNIKLTWNEVTGASGYEVWWGVNSPYFMPGTSCEASPSSCISVLTTSLEHIGASGSTTTNYNYQVIATQGATKSPGSNRVAEFDFALTPGK